MIEKTDGEEMKAPANRSIGTTQRLVVAGACLAAMSSAEAQNLKHESPWGIALGAEHSSRYPDFHPLLQEAGVTWLRYFAEWQSIQPSQGEWEWDWSDAFVADAHKHGISVAGVFMYFARWASADGQDTRAFPVKDLAFFREYVRETASRYQKDIRYWEVWNEMNSPGFNRRGTTQNYADMVRVAYEEVKKIDPGIKIGLTVAANDVRWLESAIKDGAADHFDYVCIHPYNNIKLVFGTEQSYLTLRESVRKMLDAHQQREDIEIWVSEIGLTTTEDPAQLERQAEALAKAYVLGIVQGFEKFFWFEAMGPKYGEGVHAIINENNQPYPAYHALKAMTDVLGPVPEYLGWLNPGGESMGFVFQSPGQKASMAFWLAKPGATATFEQDVVFTDLAGTKRTLRAGEELSVGSSPLFLSDLPDDLAQSARANKTKPFPWFKDYGDATEISIILGATNEEHGLRQGNIDPRADGITLPGTHLGVSYRATDLGNKRPFMYFEVDRSFMGWGDRECEITVVARRAHPDHPATITLVYESETGYHEWGKRTFWPGMNVELLAESESWRAPEVWYLEAGEDWQEKTWKIRDANFIAKWGWNFQINVESSPGDVHVAEVRITKARD